MCGIAGWIASAETSPGEAGLERMLGALKGALERGLTSPRGGSQ